MILGIGTDLLDVSRMEEELRSGGAGFREAVFTPGESAYCGAKRYPARHFAARFAAKEALLKALPGAGPAPPLREIEVQSDPEGRPSLVLHGRARERAARLGVARIFLSLSHTGGVAAAQVVLES